MKIRAFYLGIFLFLISAGGVFAEDLDEIYVTNLPTDDGTIRANMVDTNYSTKTNLEMDVREGSRRYGLIRFDASAMKSEIDTSSRIMFRYYGTTEERCRRLLLYPLYGAHKNFSESTLTWSVATGIMDNGVSLTEYLDNVFVTPIPPTDAKWHEIDVTDYIKSQGDYIYAFKTWASPGSTNASIIRSKEQQSFEPQLRIYTDVNYITKNTASKIASEVNTASLTHDVELPTEFILDENQKQLCQIEWESDNEDVFKIEEASDKLYGRISMRPSAYEGIDKTTTLTMRVKYLSKVYEEKLLVRVLRENVVPADCDTFTNGGSFSNQNHAEDLELVVGNPGISELFRNSYIQFSELSENQSNFSDRIILRIYNNNEDALQKGTIKVQRVSYSEDLREINGENSVNAEIVSEEIASEVKYGVYTDIDVTDITDIGGSNIFKISSDNDEIVFYSMNSDYSPELIFYDYTLSQLNSGALEIISSLGDREEVYSDITIKNNTQFSAQYSVDNYELGNVADDTISIIRPDEMSHDRALGLTIKLSDGKACFYSTVPLLIKKSEPMGINGKRELRDPMKTSDERFFGEWDSRENSWRIAPILQYNGEELGNVEYYAKQGHYNLAKEELLAYYKSKDNQKKYNVRPSTSFNLTTELASEQIIGNQSAISTFSITNELCWNEIEIAPSKGIESSYMLFDRSKDGSTAVFNSHESKFIPYLRVSVSTGEEYVFEAVSDAYVMGAQNSENNYGTEEVLMVHEEGNPFNKNSKRTFLNFDLSKFDDTKTITSISIMIYGKKICGKSDKMDLVLYSAPLLAYMDEKSVKWSDHTPGTFNLKGEIYDRSAPYGSESEWIFSLSRQNVNESLVSYYLGVGNDNYAYAALENIMGIYSYQESGFPRALDTAWRTPNLLACAFGLIDSPYMTPEVFTALVKYGYEIMVFLDGQTASVVNQINAVDTGFTRMVIYFPEVHDNSYYEKSKKRHDDTFGRVISYSDGSYKEATNGYIAGLLEEMKEVIEMYEMAGLDGSEMYTEKTHALATFYSGCQTPDGYLVPYGDGGRVLSREIISDFGEFFDDDELRFIGSGGVLGHEPSYDSRIFDNKKVVMMRNGWSRDAMYAFMNSEYGHSHGHPDNLHMDVYAYGRPLLVDAGNGGGYNPISPAGYVRLETYPHNTVEVGEEAQTYSIGETGLTLMGNNSFDYVEGFTDANDGYRHTRKVMFVKNKFFIVSDLLVPEDLSVETVYKQNWHPDNYANLEIDSETGKAATHFEGTANLQILQADIEGIEVNREQSYIRSNKLVNLMEDYVSYKKTTSGVATYNTLLYPTKAGENDSAEFKTIPLSDNQDSGTAAAMEIDFSGSKGVYYISNEDNPTVRGFGEYTTDGQNVYVEKSSDGVLNQIILVGGSYVDDAKGEHILMTDKNVSNIGAVYDGATLAIESDGSFDFNLLVKLDGVKYVTVNGVKTDFTNEDGKVLVKSKVIKFDVTVQGSKMVGVAQEDIVVSYALNHSGKTKTLSVTIEKGTAVSGDLGWDGNVNFSVDEDEGLFVSLDAPDYSLSFDKPVKISIPFYDTKKSYFVSSNKTLSFGSASGASATDTDSGVLITTAVGGKYVFPTLKGAASASDSSGGGNGGGGGSSGGNTAVLPNVQDNDKPAENTEKNTFSDIESHWAKNEILSLWDLGIINGYEDNTFRPDAQVTRAEFAVMIARAFLGDEEWAAVDFTDVNENDWFYSFVGKCVGKDIINGYSDKTFVPNGIITREEAAKLLIKILSEKMGSLSEGELDEFSDSTEVSPWAYDYFKKSVGMGVITGDENKCLKPHMGITRAMAATMIVRINNILNEEESK